MPEVSIIIPVYNVEPYLRLCLDSVSAQTFKDFEALLVDDGSTDGGGDICVEYAVSDARFRVIRQENAGLSAARNTGIKNARGKYLYFADSDDWLERDAVEALRGAMENGCAEYAVCGYFREGRDEGLFLPREVPEAVTRMSSMLRYARKEFSFAVWNKMYLRETVAGNGILFYEGEKYVEDHAFNLRYLLFCGKTAVVSRPLYHYRSRPGQISAESPLTRIPTYLEDTKRLVGDFMSHGKFDDYREVLGVHFAVRFNELMGACLTGASARGKDGKALLAQVKKLRCETGLTGAGSSAHLAPKEKLFLFLLGLGNAGLLRRCYRLNALMKKAAGSLAVRRGFRAYARGLILHRSFFLRRIYLGYVEKSTAHKHVPPAFFPDAAGPRLFLIGTPEYGNMGDQAIAAAERQFLEREFPALPLAEISENEAVLYFHELKKRIRPADIIVLQGGGNMGSSYPDQEMIRKKVLRAFPENATVVFPQTISFSDESESSRILKAMRRYYDAHKNLLLCAREKRSYGIMSENLSSSTALVPDAAFLLPRPCASLARKGALICLRSDGERVLSREDGDIIRFACLKKFGCVEETDTCVDFRVDKYNRKTALDDLLRRFMSAELVVTDRLHGMILSAVTETPCAVFNNSNHKISGSFEWIKSLGFIRLCGNASGLEACADAALSAQPKYNTLKFAGLFGPVADFIRENSNGRN